jgi:hypothetical protein
MPLYLGFCNFNFNPNYIPDILNSEIVFFKIHYLETVEDGKFWANKVSYRTATFSLNPLAGNGGICLSLPLVFGGKPESTWGSLKLSTCSPSPPLPKNGAVLIPATALASNMVIPGHLESVNATYYM